MVAATGTQPKVQRVRLNFTTGHSIVVRQPSQLEALMIAERYPGFPRFEMEVIDTPIGPMPNYISDFGDFQEWLALVMPWLEFEVDQVAVDEYRHKDEHGNYLDDITEEWNKGLPTDDRILYLNYIALGWIADVQGLYQALIGLNPVQGATV